MERASLNAFLMLWSSVAIVVSAVFLLIGVFLIRRGQRVWHHRMMLTASAFAVIFLILYLLEWALVGVTLYEGPAQWRGAYLAFLGIHELMATLNLPLGIVVLYNAFRGRFATHRRWARLTVPVWLYVAASGWVIYLVLLHYGKVQSGTINFFG
jgi:putative membrane protein